MLSRNLKVLRNFHGMSQGDLAKTLGVTPAQICVWETGRHDLLRGEFEIKLQRVEK